MAADGEVATFNERISRNVQGFPVNGSWEGRVEDRMVWEISWRWTQICSHILKSKRKCVDYHDVSDASGHFQVYLKVRILS